MNGLLSLFDCCRWCSKYSWTASSVILPVDHAPYPVAQKCRPQYRFSRCGNSCCISRDRAALLSVWANPTAQSAGGYSMCIWTWSLDTTPFKMRTSSASQICTSKSRHRNLMSPCRTWQAILCYPNNMRGQSTFCVWAFSVLFHLSLSSNRF